jgi:hypothetical protein
LGFASLVAVAAVAAILIPGGAKTLVEAELRPELQAAA